MNKVEITGNLTADVELKQTTGGKIGVRFHARRAQTAHQRQSGFYRLHRMGQHSGIYLPVFHKGDAIEITGSINTDTIARRCAKCGADNKQRKATVSVDTAEFPATKRAAQETPAFAGAAAQFEEIPAGDEQLPF